MPRFNKYNSPTDFLVHQGSEGTGYANKVDIGFDRSGRPIPKISTRSLFGGMNDLVIPAEDAWVYSDSRPVQVPVTNENILYHRRRAVSQNMGMDGSELVSLMKGLPSDNQPLNFKLTPSGNQGQYQRLSGNPDSIRSLINSAQYAIDSGTLPNYNKSFVPNRLENARGFLDRVTEDARSAAQGLNNALTYKGWTDEPTSPINVNSSKIDDLIHSDALSYMGKGSTDMGHGRRATFNEGSMNPGNQHIPTQHQMDNIQAGLGLASFDEASLGGSPLELLQAKTVRPLQYPSYLKRGVETANNLMSDISGWSNLKLYNPITQYVKQGLDVIANDMLLHKTSSPANYLTSTDVKGLIKQQVPEFDTRGNIEDPTMGMSSYAPTLVNERTGERYRPPLPVPAINMQHAPIYEQRPNREINLHAFPDTTGYPIVQSPAPINKARYSPNSTHPNLMEGLLYSPDVSRKNIGYTQDFGTDTTDPRSGLIGQMEMGAESLLNWKRQQQALADNALQQKIDALGGSPAINGTIGDGNTVRFADVARFVPEPSGEGLTTDSGVKYRNRPHRYKDALVADYMQDHTQHIDQVVLANRKLDEYEQRYGVPAKGVLGATKAPMTVEDLNNNDIYDATDFRKFDDHYIPEWNGSNMELGRNVARTYGSNTPMPTQVVTQSIPYQSVSARYGGSTRVAPLRSDVTQNNSYLSTLPIYR